MTVEVDRPSILGTSRHRGKQHASGNGGAVTFGRKKVEVVVPLLKILLLNYLVLDILTCVYTCVFVCVFFFFLKFMVRPVVKVDFKRQLLPGRRLANVDTGDAIALDLALKTFSHPRGSGYG